MNTGTQGQLQSKIHEIVIAHGSNKSALIPCLKYLQQEFGQITEDGMAAISKELKVSRVYILGVASFYGMFSTEKQGKYIIRVCNSLSCNMLGSENLIEILKDELRIGKGETTSDGMFTFEVVACLGCCDLAPAMMVNEKVYGNLDAAKVQEIVNSLRKQA